MVARTGEAARARGFSGQELEGKGRVSDLYARIKIGPVAIP